MPPDSRRLRAVIASFLVAGIAGACADENQPAAPANAPKANVLSIPIDSLHGDAPFLAIARELPSFAGFWYNDQDQIVIGLTDVADLEAAVPLVQEHITSHQPTGGYVAEAAQYSFLELARYRTALFRYVFGIDGVVALGVNESDNRVKIGIAEALAAPLVGDLLSTLGIPEETVIFEDWPYPTLDSHTLDDQHPDGDIEGGGGSPRQQGLVL